MAEVWWDRYTVDNNMMVEAAIEHVHILWHGKLQHDVVDREWDRFRSPILVMSRGTSRYRYG